MHPSYLRMYLTGGYDPKLVKILNDGLVPLGWPKMVLIEQDGIYYIESLEVWVNDYKVERKGAAVWGSRSRN